MATKLKVKRINPGSTKFIGTLSNDEVKKIANELKLTDNTDDKNTYVSEDGDSYVANDGVLCTNKDISEVKKILTKLGYLDKEESFSDMVDAKAGVVEARDVNSAAKSIAKIMNDIYIGKPYKVYGVVSFDKVTSISSKGNSVYIQGEGDEDAVMLELPKLDSKGTKAELTEMPRGDKARYSQLSNELANIVRKYSKELDNMQSLEELEIISKNIDTYIKDEFGS